MHIIPPSYVHYILAYDREHLNSPCSRNCNVTLPAFQGLCYWLRSNSDNCGSNCVALLVSTHGNGYIQLSLTRRWEYSKNFNQGSWVTHRFTTTGLLHIPRLIFIFLLSLLLCALSSSSLLLLLTALSLTTFNICIITVTVIIVIP